MSWYLLNPPSPLADLTDRSAQTCLSKTSEKSWWKPQENLLKLVSLLVAKRSSDLPIDIGLNIKKICTFTPEPALYSANH